MNRWISISRPRPSASVRLYCLPYAGGSSAIFHRWGAELPAWIEVCAVELPGRGRRIAERAFLRVSEAAEALSRTLSEHIDRPFAVFGHSMGGLIAFEALRMMQRQGIRPQVFFASATPAPQVPRLDPPTYRLPENELLQELRRLNGTPPEVLEDPELLTIMLPVVRADLELCQTYRHRAGEPLQCPLVALGGLEDEEVGEEEIEAWRNQAGGSFRKVLLAGDHFFINSAPEAVLETLQRHLKPNLSR